MNNYRLVYKQPYEYDDDSPSGIGDHGISYANDTMGFEAEDDTNARIFVSKFLEEGGYDFGHHNGSQPAGYYKRQFVSLVEFNPDREVEYGYSNT